MRWVFPLMFLSVCSANASLHVTADLDVSGLGLLALPVQAVTSVGDMSVRGVTGQNLAGLVGSLPASGYEGTVWRLDAELAAYGVVNIGALSVVWREQGADRPSVIGLKLGVLNTSVPAVCDGTEHVALKLRSISEQRALSLAKVGALNDTTSVLIKYRCSL